MDVWLKGNSFALREASTNPGMMKVVLHGNIYSQQTLTRNLSSSTQFELTCLVRSFLLPDQNGCQQQQQVN